MDIPYYEQLGRIRKCLEESVDGFPKQQCVKATRAVNLIMGFEFRQGLYVPAKSKRESKWERNPSPAGHAWGYDPSLDVNVDLTLDQFDERHSKVSVLSSKVKFWKYDWESTLKIKSDPKAFEEIDGYLESFFERYNQLYS